MKKRSLSFVISAWSMVIVALVVVGCSATSTQSPGPESAPYEPGAERGATEQSAPLQQTPRQPNSSSAQIEEVVVTAEKRETSSRDKRLARLARVQARKSRVAPTRPSRIIPSSVMPGEELWIISKSEVVTDGQHSDDRPGSGAMMAKMNGEQRALAMPLQHTQMAAQIEGYISSVHVKQKFQNPFDSKIEAVYLFPLPEKAAVTEFVMQIGERRIRGILRDKTRAEEIYRAAKSQGYRASLMTQHRPNIFEQKVANIEPGKSIDVDVTYFHTLAYNDGWYEFVFPTVVGPRFNPPGTRDPINAVGRAGRRAPAPAGTSVTYLRSGERTSHDLSIDVSIDAGKHLREVKSSHRIKKRKLGDVVHVELASGSMIPNEDFVLRYRVAGKEVSSQLLTHTDERSGEGYFTLMLHPPLTTQGDTQRRSMEMVFVLDCSGSMSGTPLTQAKAAVKRALRMLNEDDTFQIIRFSDNSSSFGYEPVLATKANKRRALSYLRSLNGTGGTQMVEGIRAALDFPHDRKRLRFVSFLTDGYIGNETDVLAVMQDHIGDSRVFSVGVGSSVNRYLMERMAKVGRGAAAFLGPRDDGGEIMENFFSRISHPALTDLEIDWGGMIVDEVYPRKLPDLFVGRPVVITGRYVGATDRVRVSGQLGEGQADLEIAAPLHGQRAELAPLWARLKIADLSDQSAVDGDPNGDIASAIKSTALQYGLMSAYTAFVAVDATQQTAGDWGTTVNQPVPVPAGVRYDTAVGN